MSYKGDESKCYIFTVILGGPLTFFAFFESISSITFDWPNRFSILIHNFEVLDALYQMQS